MKKLTKGFKKNEGFTLMEIIIVIVILGILALIAVPRLIGFTTQAEIATDKEYAAVVARAAELYWAANDKPATVAITDLTGANMVDLPGDGTDGALQYYKGVHISMGEVDTGYEGIATVRLSVAETSADTDVVYNTIKGYHTVSEMDDDATATVPD